MTWGETNDHYTQRILWLVLMINPYSVSALTRLGSEKEMANLILKNAQNSCFDCCGWCFQHHFLFHGRIYICFWLWNLWRMTSKTVAALERQKKHNQTTYSSSQKFLFLVWKKKFLLCSVYIQRERERDRNHFQRQLHLISSLSLQDKTRNTMGIAMNWRRQEKKICFWRPNAIERLDCGRQSRERSAHKDREMSMEKHEKGSKIVGKQGMTFHVAILHSKSNGVAQNT